MISFIELIFSVIHDIIIADLLFYHVLYKQIPLTAVTSVIDGLKKLYIEKLKPLEVTYKFNDFVSPLLVHTCILDTA